MIRSTRALLLAAAIAFVPAAFAQTPALPDTPQGQTLKTWIEAINNPDPAVAQAVAPFAARVRGDFGPLNVIAVEPGAANEIATVFREGVFGNHMRMVWMFDPADPTKIVGARVQPAPGGPVGSPGTELEFAL